MSCKYLITHSFIIFYFENVSSFLGCKFFEGKDSVLDALVSIHSAYHSFLYTLSFGLLISSYNFNYYLYLGQHPNLPFQLWFLNHISHHSSLHYVPTTLVFWFCEHISFSPLWNFGTSWNPPPPDLYKDRSFSWVRSQLKCCLLREAFPDPLPNIAPLSSVTLAHYPLLLSS